MANREQWTGFKGKNWQESVDVRDFIQCNYTPYEGDASFLEGPTEATDKLWGRLQTCIHALRRNQYGGEGLYNIRLSAERKAS